MLIFNRTVEPAVGRARLSTHLCFGNFFGRPLSKRVYRPVLEQALAFDVGEFVLEWANREMAELDVAADITAAGRHLSAGVIDVKNYYLETADDVDRFGQHCLENKPSGTRSQHAHCLG